MDRLTALCAVLLVTGCASGAPSVPAAGVPQTRDNELPASGNTSAPAGSSTQTVWVQTTHRAAISSQAINAPIDRVWSVLPQVYSDLGLPLTTVASSTKVVGTEGKRLRRIGGKGLATYFNCAGPYGNASSYDVYVSVRTQLFAGGEGETEARTQVSALAKAPTGSNRLECASTGELEALIAQQVLERSAAAR